MTKHKLDPADVAILEAHAFGKTREFLLTHPEYKPTPLQRKRLASFLRRRTKHEPVAMIVGRKAFFDVELEVTKGVLVPRPETELLVEETLASVGPAAAHPHGAHFVPPHRGGVTHRPIIVDVGSGSGAIALTLAKHLTKADIVATDLSSKALSLAKKNARRLGLARRVRFVKTDLLPKQGGKTPPLHRVIVVANLPYLPTEAWRSAAPDVKKFEPRSALDGGRDGLDAYRRLFQKIKKQGLTPSTIIIEIDPSQKKLLPAVVRGFFPTARVTFKKDLAGRWRVCAIRP